MHMSPTALLLVEYLVRLKLIKIVLWFQRIGSIGFDLCTSDAWVERDDRGHECNSTLGG